jgi:hypothetical protein
MIAPGTQNQQHTDRNAAGNTNGPRVNGERDPRNSGDSEHNEAPRIDGGMAKPKRIDSPLRSN